MYIWLLCFVYFSWIILKYYKNIKLHFYCLSLSGQLSPVWLTQFIWGTLTSTAILICSHLYGPLWVEKEQLCSLTTGLRQHFLCKLSNPGVLAAAGQRSTGSPALHPLPGCPSSHHNLLITAVCLWEGGEKKTFATGLAALGGAVAKGRVSLSDG